MGGLCLKLRFSFSMKGRLWSDLFSCSSSQENVLDRVVFFFSHKNSALLIISFMLEV